jgi:hypothetical protein
METESLLFESCNHMSTTTLHPVTVTSESASDLMCDFLLPTHSRLTPCHTLTSDTHSPSCASQGPVWAVCMLSTLIVPLGAALVISTKLTNVVSARMCGLASAGTGMCVLPATPYERATRKGWRTTKVSAWTLTKRCARTTSEGSWWTWSLPEHWNCRCIARVQSRFLKL